MTVSVKDVEKTAKTKREGSLDIVESAIDGELLANSKRLDKGLSVMIPCLHPYNALKPLLAKYTKKGWKVQHEHTGAYGRLYFSK